MCVCVGVGVGVGMRVCMCVGVLGVNECGGTTVVAGEQTDD